MHQEVQLETPEQGLNGISIDEIKRGISILFTHGNSHCILFLWIHSSFKDAEKDI